jgi:hypothetical protein
MGLFLLTDYEGRRLKRLTVHPSAIVSLLSQDGAEILTITGMPEDAKIVHTHFDHTSDQLTFTIESEEFNAVRTGSIIPTLQLDVKMEKVIRTEGDSPQKKETHSSRLLASEY